MSSTKCKMIELPKILERRGNLTFIESLRHIPFDIKRVYYLYDVPGGAFKKKEYYLNRSYYGLYIPTMTWREIENFSSGSVCLVLASELYDEDDYIRDYREFEKLVIEGNNDDKV